MYAPSHARTWIRFISLLLANALILSLLAPFAIKRAQASVLRDRSVKKNASVINRENRELSRNSSDQRSGQRPGELLVRFREGVSEQGKASALAAHGGRISRLLRGESGIAKFEVTSEPDLETVAQQLRLNPAVEFVEPNFLIQRDDLRVDEVRSIPRPLTAPLIQARLTL
jgi:hypothetical protein